MEINKEVASVDWVTSLQLVDVELAIILTSTLKPILTGYASVTLTSGTIQKVPSVVSHAATMICFLSLMDQEDVIVLMGIPKIISASVLFVNFIKPTLLETKPEAVLVKTVLKILVTHASAAPISMEGQLETNLEDVFAKIITR